MWTITPHLNEASDKITQAVTGNLHSQESLSQSLRSLAYPRLCSLTIVTCMVCCLPLPAWSNKKAVGFIAHMDTAPDFSGENVKPQLLRHYDGSDVLLRGNGEYLRVSDFPELKALSGRTLITTDGTTLLGADDKAGVAEIMTALEQIIAEGTPHGDIWVGFTPDEEVGKGADLFDLDYFEADFPTP